MPGLAESLWRYRWTLVVVTMAAALLAGLLSYLQPVRYETTARMFLDDPSSAAVFEEVGPKTTDPSRYAQNQAELVMTRPVAERASELLDGRLSPRRVLRSVEVTSSTDFDLVMILATDSTPEGAAELANAVGRAYQDMIAEDVEATADSVVERLEQNAAQLEERIARAEARLAEGGNAALQAERDSAIAELLRVEQRANQLAVEVSLFGSGVRLAKDKKPKPLEEPVPAPVEEPAPAPVEEPAPAPVEPDPAPVDDGEPPPDPVTTVVVHRSDSNAQAQAKIDGAGPDAVVSYETGVHAGRSITPLPGPRVGQVRVESSHRGCAHPCL